LLLTIHSTILTKKINLICLNKNKNEQINTQYDGTLVSF
jgi:hypothetical protein